MSKAGFVSIVGESNTGKSTLLNRLVGQKVTSVTHKVQTTQRRILGIMTREDSQVVLVDTPGIFNAKKPLERAMVKVAWSAPQESDLTVLLVDATRKDQERSYKILKTLQKRQTSDLVICLNKIDRINKEKLLKLTADFLGQGPIQEVFMISALKGSGVKVLENHLAHHVPEGPWLYPEGQITDLSQRSRVEDIVREKIFLNLHQELPYEMAVEVEQWNTRKDGSLFVDVTVYVERSGHKALALGAGGRTIKRIGMQARKDLEALLGQRMHLKIFVKMDKNERLKRSYYESIGLDLKRN